MAAVYEGRCKADEAAVAKLVKPTVTSVYKTHPDRGAPTSLDTKLFDDGNDTVGDRLSSDIFKF